MNPYLTYQEYLQYSISPNKVQEGEVFNQLLSAAQFKIDLQTYGFYFNKDLETDFEQRKMLVKRAVAAMIDYFDYSGGVNAYEIQNNSASVTIGRTTLSNSNSTASQNSTLVNGLPRDVYDALKLSGLLYRGVRTTCL